MVMKMRNRRTVKHYLLMYLIIVVVYFVYMSILAIRDGEYNPAMLFSLIYLPILFVGFMYVFDTIFDTIFGRKKKQKEKADKDFFKVLTEAINRELDLSIEDFRRLRENERFQKALQQAHKIKDEGETDDMNFTLLTKKFKRNTREYQAMAIVIDEVKKMMSN